MAPVLEKLVDIGVNLTNNRFLEDLPATLERANNAGVDTLIITGTSLEESRKALDLCERWQNKPLQLFATAGIHPHHAVEFDNETVVALKTLADRKHIVAVGETGLDFNRNFSPPDKQQLAFEQQLQLAAETGLPVFMHEREAHSRQLEILREFRDKICRGVIHCFTGPPEALHGYLDLDLYIGITGWICDPKRGRELQTLVQEIPADRLMVETDAPYLLPKALPADKLPPRKNRNEPSLLPWIVMTVARYRSESAQDLAQVTTRNAREFFALT